MFSYENINNFIVLPKDYRLVEPEISRLVEPEISRLVEHEISRLVASGNYMPFESEKRIMKKLLREIWPLTKKVWKQQKTYLFPRN